jgi:hypothetical protein
MDVQKMRRKSHVFWAHRVSERSYRLCQLSCKAGEQLDLAAVARWIVDAHVASFVQPRDPQATAPLASRPR